MEISTEVIYNTRVAANLSRDVAAKLTCVARRTWDSWETGQRKMPESSFRFFVSQVTKQPLLLKYDLIREHTDILIFFDYSHGIVPIDSVSPEVFMALENVGPDEAEVTCLTLNMDGTRSPRKFRFKISDNKDNYSRLQGWSE